MRSLFDIRKVIRGMAQTAVDRALRKEIKEAREKIKHLQRWRPEEHEIKKAIEEMLGGESDYWGKEREVKITIPPMFIEHLVTELNKYQLDR